MSSSQCAYVDSSEGNWWFWCSKWFALAKASKISMLHNFLKMQIDVVEFDIAIGDTTDWNE